MKSSENMSKEEIDLIKQSEFYSYDQSGCRMLQKKLEEKRFSEFNNQLIKSVIHLFQDLMTD